MTALTTGTLTGPLHYCSQPESGGAWGQQDQLGCISYRWSLRLGKFRDLQHLGPMTLKSAAKLSHKVPLGVGYDQAL